jgi:hypothetical protein
VCRSLPSNIQCIFRRHGATRENECLHRRGKIATRHFNVLPSSVHRFGYYESHFSLPFNPWNWLIALGDKWTLDEVLTVGVKVHLPQPILF